MKTIHKFIVLFLFLAPALTFGQSVFEIRFTAGMTQHRAALVLYDGGLGKMRVRYYNQSRGTTMVEQTIRVENTLDGYRLTGYSPVYPGTTVRHPNYVADNFYVSQNEYGSLSIINVDDRGSYSRASICLVDDYYEKKGFLNEFSWVLN